MLSNTADSANNIPFIDIHTHRRTTSAGVISITNFSQKDLENGQNTEGASHASVGMHPWFLTTKNFHSDFEKMSQLAQNQHIVAIGECGLDKLRGEDLAFQTTAFEAQIRLAQSVLKPVIVHCVKAFGEVAAVKKRLEPTVPLIIHGFNKKADTLKNLLRNDFFISIGAVILQKKRSHTEGSDFSEILRQIPLDRLFFETDAADDVSISDIYEAAADRLEIDINYLKSIIYRNYETIFHQTAH